MSVKTDVVNLRVNVGNDKAQNQLNELRKTAADLKFEMNGLNKRTKEYADKKKELAAIEGQMGELKKTIGLAALSQRELNKELKTLTALKGSVVPFSEEYKQLQGRIKQVKNRLYEVNNGVRGFSAAFSKVKDEVKQFGMLAAGYLGFQFITQSFSNLISSAGKLSDSLADLQRVSGLTASQASNLNEEFKKLDTRTSTEGLRQIAIVAGKLGVAKDELLSFTQAVDMLVVALGDELGDADAITSTLGKVLQVFDGKISGENITRLANAFVELANTGSSTGAFIADFDQRLSGIAKSANFSLGALSGLGAGLEELGGRVESSSTAVQKIITSIAKDIPAAAKIAGVDVGKFQELFASKPQEALLQYAQGLVKNKQSFSEIVQEFANAGEEGARVIETLSKMGTSADYLRQRMELGEKAIAGTAAITDAFNLKNQTLGASIDKLSKEFNKLISSSGVQNFLKGLINFATGSIAAVKSLGEWISRNTLSLTLWSAALVINTGLWGKMIGLFSSALTWLNNLTVAVNANTIAQKASMIATTAWGVVVALFTGNMAKLRQEFALLKVMMGTNPLGIFLIALGAAILAVKALGNEIQLLTTKQRAYLDVEREALTSMAEQKSQIDRLTNAINSEVTSLETKKEALKDLISINPEYLKGLTLQNIATGEGIELLRLYNEQMMTRARLAAANSIINEKSRKDAELLAEQMRLEMEIANNPNRLNRKPDYDLAQIKKERAALSTEMQAFMDLATKTQQQLNEMNPKKLVLYLPPDTNKAGTGSNAKSVVGKTVEQKTDKGKKENVKAQMDIYDRLWVEAYTEKPLRFPKVKVTAETLKEAKQQTSSLLADVQQELNRSNKGRQAALELKVMQSRGMNRLKAYQDLLMQEAYMELQNTELTEEQKELIRAKYRQQSMQAEMDYWMNVGQTAIAVFQSIDNVLSAHAAYKNTLEENAFNKEKKRLTDQKNIYQSQLNQKLISQELYNKKTQDIDAQLAKKEQEMKKRQFQRDKQAKLRQTIISGAQAIVQTFAQWGWPLGIPFAAGMAIATGLQVAAISKQEPPEYGRGALLRNGPKHNSSSRGLPIINPDTGKVEALVERGEAVISARAMDDNSVYEVKGTTRQITSALNGRAGGRTWAGGATVKPISSAPGWMTTRGPSIISSMPRMMAEGGTITGSAANDANATAMLEEMQMQRAELRAMRADMARWRATVKAVVSIKEYREMETLYDQSISESGL